MSHTLRAEAVLICSHGRREHVLDSLHALSQCTHLPEHIIVIESGTNEALPFADTLLYGSEVIHLMTQEVSLPFKREWGIQSLPPAVELVHFIDDDFLVEPTYFLHLSRVLHTGRYLAAGGLILPMLQQTSAIHWFSRFFLMDSALPGRVLASGWTSESQSRNDLLLNELTEVQWLSGCAMSFRREVFNTLHFDTNLTGYAQDEDLDFSYQVTQHGTIVAVREAKGTHLNLGKNSVDEATRFERRYQGRIRFLKKHLNTGWARFCMTWSLLGMAIILLRKPFRYRSLLRNIPSFLVSIWHT